MQWWQKPVRVCQIHPELVPAGTTEEELGDLLNPDKVLKGLADKHANVLIFTAKVLTGQAFYHSSFVPAVEIDTGGRDLLREYIRAAHENDVKILAYVIVSLDLHIYRKHPEWAQVNPEGKPSIRPEMPSYPVRWAPLCPNSPFREYTIKVLREIVENYEVDGIFLDMPQWFPFYAGVVCYCSYCRKAFGEKYGTEPPTEPDWSNPTWRDFVRWRYDVITGYIDEMSRTIRTSRAGIPIIPNVMPQESWLSGWRVEDIARCVDVIAPETAVDTAHLLGETTRHCLAAGEHLAVWPPVAIWSTPLPTRQGVEKALWEIVGNGGSPWFLYNVFRSEEEPYKSMSETYGQLEQLQEHIADLKPAKGVALFYSSSSRDWYGGTEPARHVDSFKGFYQAFVENQVQFNMLLERHLTVSELAKYPALVLPNAACLSDEQAAVIEQYVAGGGGLVACYESSLYDENGRQRPDFALAEVFGASLGGVSPDLHRFCARQAHPLTAGLKVGLKVPIAGAVLVGPTDRDVPARLQRSVEGLHSMPTLTTGPENPFIVAGAYGKGKVVYLAADVGRAHWKNSMPEYNRLILNSVNWVLKAPLPFHVKAPTTVEANLLENPEGTRKVLHLLNHSTNQVSKAATVDASKEKYGLSGFAYSTPTVSPVRCFVPVRNVEITIAKQPAEEIESISAFPADVAIKTHIDTETITIDVCELVSHITLVTNFKVDL